MTETLYIRDDRSLGGLVAKLGGVSEIALDTEFLRERTYYPKLCLLQLAADDVLALVDPLSISEMGPLWELLTGGPEVLLHAAGQDLEIVLRHAGALPRRHFDTQVAAAFVGYGDSIGYARMVERILGTTLRRSEAYTDWSRRPLTNEQQGYALDDVRYLGACAAQLRSELADRGRAEWVAQELQLQAGRVEHSPDPESQWRRVSGARGLSGMPLAVLQAVTAWREQEATRRDVPRQRVVPDRVLVEIARRRPASRNVVERLRGIHPREAERSADAIIEQVRRATGLSESEWPRWPSAPPSGADVRVDEIASYIDAWVRARGRELELSSRLLATRKEMERMVRYELAGSLEAHTDRIPLLQGWRREVAGNSTLALLRGQAGLRLQVDAAGPQLALDSAG